MTSLFEWHCAGYNGTICDYPTDSKFTLSKSCFLIDIKNAYAYNNIRGRACSSSGLTLKSDMLVNHVIDRWRTTLKSDIFTSTQLVVGRQH